MPGGNSFDEPLKWDRDHKGFIATGPHDWKSCDWITVVVFQNGVVATAQGKPVRNDYADGRRGWKLPFPLVPTEPNKRLKNGRVRAAAVALMTSEDGTGRRLIAWDTRRDRDNPDERGWRTLVDGP